MQGVCINLFIKTGEHKKEKLATVLHYDLYGKREFKYDTLLSKSIVGIDFKVIDYKAPNYFFVPKDFSNSIKYNEGFSLANLFTLYSAGIVTARDSFTISDNAEKLYENINEFVNLDTESARIKFSLGEDVRDWKVEYAKRDLKESGVKHSNIVEILYRPFDIRYTYFTGKSKGFHCMPRGEVMKHIISKNNLALTLCKQYKTGNNYNHVFISNRIIESCYVSNRTSEITSIFPLYQYNNGEVIDNEKPNLNETIIAEIAKGLGLTFTNEREGTPDTFAPIDLLDYIYAVLHSPTYREKYKEFLKIDFPRVPYPTDKVKFWQLVKLGGDIRQIHLLESPAVTNYITKYPVDGSNTVEKPDYKDGNVWINSEQYFEGVPEIAWTFYIGGYQPAQKWLKDRKGRELSIDDIMHYQKIIVALTETDRLMKEIDKIEIV